jgi:hypothetical protein
MLDLFGLTLKEKMVIRLFKMPIFLAIGTLFFLFLEISVPEYQENSFKTPFSSLLIRLNQYIEMGYLWGSLIFSVLLCLSFLYSSYRYWKWDEGDDAEICRVCGGITAYREGRFGPYYKCMACGKNRSIYR